MRAEIAMMRTPDGHSRLEISRFLTPPAVADHRNAPVNALGYLRIMFAVEDIDDTLARLRSHGAELVGELAQYEDQYRLCYVRGPGGSSSDWPSRSASGLNFRDGREPSGVIPERWPTPGRYPLRSVER
jgi:catechol 2,3-dioxygenase-like lactoylglutathione lyase family enzyme